MSANGGLAAVSLARSSGSSALDQAALRLVRGAGPFPKPPQGARRNFSVKIQGRQVARSEGGIPANSNQALQLLTIASTGIKDGPKRPLEPLRPERCLNGSHSCHHNRNRAR
ncbi:MAG TPA: energy transducer TonB [Roseovarius sp.]|nr:energy transducer TonB [Roseovarius sp.]